MLRYLLCCAIVCVAGANSFAPAALADELGPLNVFAGNRDPPRNERDDTSSPRAVPLPPPPAPREPGRLSAQLQVPIERIKLTGNTIFSDVELAPLVAPYEGRELTSEQLQNLRETLTRHYIEHGYINSGALIPDQEVVDGVIEIRIVEGRLSEVQVSGNDWLRDRYVRSRLMLDSDEPLNIEHLRERVQRLQQDRLIERLSAQLTPGLQRGEGVMRVHVQESRPYELGVSFNNRRSPSVGGLQGEVWGALLNLTGFGDSLQARFGLAEGNDNIAAGYSVPVTPRDTRLYFFLERNDADIIEAPFEPLDITSETETYGVQLVHPLLRRPGAELTGSLIFERRRSRVFIFEDDPFPDVRNGKSDVTVLRIAQEWFDRGPDHVLAARSIFSVGLDALGATSMPGDAPDGEFFAWRGQFQWVHRLGATNNQMLVRSELQLAADPLLPLEKFGVGGALTVRGYRENRLVRDNGWVTTVEGRIPVGRVPLPGLSKQRQDGLMELAPFFDFGWSWNNVEPSPSPQRIASPGIGVRWAVNQYIHGELYWGYALRDESPAGEKDLQDHGIHFNLGIQLL